MSYEISNTIIHFLDLENQQENNRLITKTFFKPVERNSYIPDDSCHHDPWLVNIPKGRFGNCTEQSVYLKKAKTIGDKFVHKRCETFINEKIQEVYQIPRYQLIQDKEKKLAKYQEIPLIMTYNVQHRQMEHIILKHWPILLADQQLHTTLPRKSHFIYKRAPTLRDDIAKNVPDPPRKSNGLFLSRKRLLSMQEVLCMQKH